MQHVEYLAARVRVRTNSGEGGDTNWLVVWLIIGGIVLAITILITALIIAAKKHALKRIETYFGAEGLVFVQNLDPKTRKAFIELITAIQMADQQIKDKNYAMDSIIGGFVTPYSALVKNNESLGWYRFVPYELDALIAHAQNRPDEAKENLRKARELRESDILLSDTAKRLLTNKSSSA